MTARWRREWRLVCMAVQFLTRLPAPAGAAFEPALMRHAARHFPLVGALVGAFGAALALAAGALWPPAVAAALAVAGTVWLTAAFHEDGLADTFDALLGAAPRDKALAIMKDSRIGSYGAAALLLGLLLRVLLLAELLARAPLAAAAAFVACHAAGRALAVALMASLPYAREGSQQAGAAVRDVTGFDVAWAVASGVLALALAASVQPAAWPAAVAAVGVLALLLLVLRGWLRRRLGGYTGDTLGAAEQFGELAVLLVFAAPWAR
ncbi:adenosylcobinamide-GDP ribazoletransferase [Piscinibacter sp.]|uniref:adenosylcobinamide-GDP ribazoletransferase n=1 Tax=Piscinibacter sp. TaxID=1903157 RepID=UPI0039E4ABB8